jgi:hypothetical protein
MKAEPLNPAVAVQHAVSLGSVHTGLSPVRDPSLDQYPPWLSILHLTVTQCARPAARFFAFDYLHTFPVDD